MKASDARRLHELEAENSKLTHLLAEAHLDMRALKSRPCRISNSLFLNELVVISDGQISCD